VPDIDRAEAEAKEVERAKILDDPVRDQRVL
jgi:hypothetical protein